MAMKKIQKAFNLSSEHVKNFIEMRIEDLAIKTQRTSSYLIENILLDGLLPKNRDARDIIKYRLYPEDKQGGVKNTLDHIFSYNAGGVDWKSKHGNFKPLVEYCLAFGSNSATYSNRSYGISYFYSQLDSVVKRITECSKFVIENEDRNMYKSFAEYAAMLKKNAYTDPENIRISEHFQLVYDCWDMLYDWSITYRYLMVLAANGEFQESAIARNDLYDIINQISEEW